MSNIGPYAEMSIITRKSDQQSSTDKETGVEKTLTALMLIGPAMLSLWFMGLFVLAHIGLIVAIGIIGTAIWACGYYGTNDSLMDRFRYRITQRRITRRLSDTPKNSTKKGDIMGLAKMIVPATDNFKEIVETGLSDQMAISYGRLFARTLSEQDGFITVILESGAVIVIGLDSINGALTIGRLNYRTTTQTTYN